MKNTLMMTMDIGTQSLRVAIFNKKGDILAHEKKTYKPAYVSPQPNFAEQNPYYYYECLTECTKKISEKNPELMKDVAAITMCCFRDTAVLLDENYEIVRPTVLWLDQRTAECKEPLPFSARFILKLVGMYEAADVNRKRCVANWLIENEPENWAKVKKYIPLSTYLIYLLTGEMKDSSSNMAGHYPIDFKNRRWYKNPETHLTAQIFSLTRDKLPDIVPEGSTIGGITEKAAEESGLPLGLKMIACGSDKSCETLGLGVITNTMGAISYGTASTVETTTTKYVESEPFLPGYPSCIPGFYNMDVQIYRGYWMVNWFLKEFGGAKIDDLITAEVSPKEYNDNLNKVPAGCDGLILQPYWGPGLARPLAKGAVIGWSDATTAQHFYRAIIEGIAYALRESLEHFEKKNHKDIETLRIAGGGSQCDGICQITADIMNKPVSRVQTHETSSLGAAMSGFLALGEFSTPQEAIDSMVRVTDTFYPNPETAKKYDYLFNNCYVKLYPSLKDIYVNIKKFNNKESKELYRKRKRNK